MEKWVAIAGYESEYEVSSLGRVKSVKTPHEHILKSNRSSNGYFTVGLSKNNKAKTFSVHRIVAMAFIENNDNKPEVNHKDGNKQNNRVENLEWVTKSENERHSIVVLGKKTPELPDKMRGKLGQLHNRSIPVTQMTKKGEFVRDWECASQVERELGIKRSNISMCCNGKRGSAGKYVFRYSNN